MHRCHPLSHPPPPKGVNAPPPRGVNAPPPRGVNAPPPPPVVSMPPSPPRAFLYARSVFIYDTNEASNERLTTCIRVCDLLPQQIPGMSATVTMQASSEISTEASGSRAQHGLDGNGNGTYIIIIYVVL